MVALMSQHLQHNSDLWLTAHLPGLKVVALHTSNESVHEPAAHTYCVTYKNSRQHYTSLL